MKRLGVDVGGTFTDAVVYDEETGRIESAKVSSTRPDAETAVLASLTKLDGHLQGSALRYLVHGTTVATNAVLESSGPRIALLTTEGFRDVIEIGRLSRSSEALYDMKAELPPRIVRRRDCFEVSERMNRHGDVLTPVDVGQLKGIASAIANRGICSVAVVLLHSYANTAHEEQIRDVLHEALPDLSISISSDVLREHREYERTTTTALNAYLVPVMSSYLNGLGSSIRDVHPGLPLWIMQSSGGVASPEFCAENPVTTLLSGPTGGVVAGQLVAQQTGLASALTIDMGGTSLDTCLLPNNQIVINHEREFMGMPIATPSVDVLAIGAGGGSIGWVDAGGQFRVGPMSAGAHPGPASYGRGGTEVTVTDANVVLGILGDGQSLGGEVTLDYGAAHDACGRIGKQLGITVLEAAWGIRRIANTAMAGAVRAVSVGRGHDPRDLGMIAFGGAGPMHAIDIAEELGIPTVVLPPVPGCHSAVGLTATDIAHDSSATILRRLDDASLSDVARVVQGMLHASDAQLADEKVESANRVLVASLDLRYVGQQFSVNVDTSLDANWMENAIRRFHQMHEKLYGFSVPGEPVEAVTVRVRAFGRLGSVERNRQQDSNSMVRDVKPPAQGSRSVCLGPGEGDRVQVPVVHRSEIVPGWRLDGPVVVEQADSTAIVPPRVTAVCDANGNLILSRGAV